MKQTMRVVVAAPLLVFLVLIVAALPELLAVRRGSLVLQLRAPLARIGDYLTDAPSGSVFVYQAGQMERSFLSDLPDYIRTSFLFATAGTGIGLLLGSTAGFFTALTQRRRLFDVLTFVGNLPDFLFIVLSQLLVIGITQLTGVRLARVGSAGITRQAILLPIIALSVYPTVAAMRIVRDRVDRIRTREYLVGARARGLSQSSIVWRHVFAGVYPILTVEAIRIHAMTVGGLFIAERLFNVAGVTRWLFNYAFILPTPSQLGRYQYAHVVNWLVALMVIYLVGLVLLNLALMAARRVMVRE